MNFARLFAVLFLGLAFPPISHSRAEEAKELPNAEALVAKGGEGRVVFEDVVQAASVSKSTGGIYLSFGAPYPNQVLSVFVGKELMSWFEPLRILPGSKVRIGGVLEKGKSGPQINLASAEDLELLPVDEAVLTGEKIDNPRDRKRYALAMRQQFLRGEFVALESAGNELSEKKLKTGDGTWMLPVFYSAFSLDATEPDTAWETSAKQMEVWKENRPYSTVRPLAEAQFHLGLAWKYRGYGYANTVSEEDAKRFGEEAAKARKILEEADPVCRKNPEYYSLMQIVALAQGWKKNEYDSLFEEGRKVDPNYLSLYFNKAFYLLPRWYGEEGDWQKFAMQERGRVGGKEGDILYARIAWAVSSIYRGAVMDQLGADWPVMREGLDKLARKYENSLWTRNARAWFAWKALDQTELKAALNSLKGEPDMSLWVNLENFQMAQKFATEGN